MLYPKTHIEVAARLNELPSGNIGLLPLTLGSEAVVIHLKQIITNPQNLPQDRSLRVWVSEQPGGRSLTENTSAATAHLTALHTTTINLIPAGVDPYDNGINVVAIPGQYWLNVLNLVNEANSFAIEVI